jgi:hypothetical protein
MIDEIAAGVKGKGITTQVEFFAYGTYTSPTFATPPTHPK